MDRAEPSDQRQNNLPEGTTLLDGLRHCWRRNPKRDFLDVLRRKEVGKAAAAGESIEALLRENAALKEENATLKQALSFEEMRWQTLRSVLLRMPEPESWRTLQDTYFAYERKASL